MSIQTQKRFAFSGILGATALFLALLALGDVPQPVLTITSIGSNQLQVVITNGVAYTNYQIYRTPVLGDTNYPWAYSATGAVGQTTFTIDMGPEPMGYFRATIGYDLDADGVPGWMDANDNDPTIGALSITIDSPTNHAVLQ